MHSFTAINTPDKLTRAFIISRGRNFDRHLFLVVSFSAVVGQILGLANWDNLRLCTLIDPTCPTTLHRFLLVLHSLLVLIDEMLVYLCDHLSLSALLVPVLAILVFVQKGPTQFFP